MTQNKIIQTTLAWQVDQSSIQTVALANTKVLDSLQTVSSGAQSVVEQLANMGVALSDVTVGGDTLTSSLVQPLAAADTSAQSVIRDLDTIATQKREIASLPDPAIGAFEGDVTDTGGGSSGSLTGSRRGLMALGSLAGGSPGLSDAARLISVTAAFGPLGLAAGAGAIALKAVTDAETARTKAAQDGADALNKIALGAAGGTTESITKQIEQQQAYKQNLIDVGKQLSDYNEEVNQTAAAYKEGRISQDEYTSVLHLIGTDVSNLTGGAVDAGSAVSNLSGVIADNQKHVDEASISIGGMNIQIKSSTVAANDAAEAAHKAALAQESEASRALAIDQLTQDQLDARAKSDERQINVLTRLVGAGNLNSEALKNVAGQIDVLNADYKAVTEASGTYGEQLKEEAAAKKAQTDATNNYLQAVTDQTVTQQAVIKALDDRNAAEQEHATALKKIQQDEQDKETQDRQQAATTAEDDTEKHLQKIADIEAQYASDHEADVGNRDALANYKDAQKRTKDEAKENATYTLQEQQLQKHLALQLVQERSAEQKSEQAETSSYMKRYGQLTTALNNAVIAESRQQGLVAAYQAQADQNSLVAQTNHNAAVQSTLQSGFFTVEYLYQKHISNLMNIVSGAPLSPGQVGTSLLGNPVFNAAFDSRFNQTMTAAYR